MKSTSKLKQVQTIIEYNMQFNKMRIFGILIFDISIKMSPNES